MYIALTEKEAARHVIDVQNAQEAANFLSRHSGMLVFAQTRVREVVENPADDPRAHTVPAKGGVTAWAPKFLK